MTTTKSNRKTGTSFERELAEILSRYGFWVHLMTQNSQGQPFDVIAARNGKTYPIDCKVCEKDLFRLERVEENQYLAMTLWRQTGNGEGWFALRLSDGQIWFLSLEIIERAMLTHKTLYGLEIKLFGLDLESWVGLCK